VWTLDNQRDYASWLGMSRNSVSRHIESAVMSPHRFESVVGRWCQISTQVIGGSSHGSRYSQATWLASCPVPPTANFDAWHFRNFTVLADVSSRLFAEQKSDGDAFASISGLYITHFITYLVSKKKEKRYPLRPHASKYILRCPRGEDVMSYTSCEGRSFYYAHKTHSQQSTV
jgi:hypothetical protein